MKYLIRILAVVITAWSPSFNLVAQAPRSGATTNKNKDSIKTTNLPSITVTATRAVSERSAEPQSSTVLEKSDIAVSRGYGLNEVLSTVPGALLQSRSGNQDVRVSIRGFGARGAGQRSNAGTSRGIRFYQDGIPETEPDGRTSFDLLDLTGAQSVEVLRTNSSSLYGNASGAVILINTVPQPEPFTILSSTFGGFGFSKQSLMVGTAIGNGQIYSNIHNTSFSGWRDHSKSSLFQFNTGFVSKFGSSSLLRVFVVGANNQFQIPGPLTQAQFDSLPTQAQNGPGYQFVNRDERRHNRLGRLGATVSHNFSESTSVDGMLFLQSKFLQRSERDAFRDFNRYHTGGSLFGKHRVDVSSEVKVSLLAGIDEQYQDGSIQFYSLASGGRGDSLRDNKREGSNNLGYFFQTGIDIGRKLHIEASGRQDIVGYYTELFPKGVRVAPISEEKQWSQFTPKFGIGYSIGDDLIAFGNFGGGVEVPAGNETDPVNNNGDDKLFLVNPRLHDPIRSQTVEVGLRGNISLSESVVKFFKFNLALYNVSVSNELVPYQSGRFYLPTGKTSRKGIECGIISKFDYGFELNFSGSLSRNAYEDYSIDSVFTKPGIDSTLLGKSAVYTGNALAGVPDFFSTLRLRWLPIFLNELSANNQMVMAELELRSVGSYFADDANRVSVAEYSMVDFSLSTKQELIDGFSISATFAVNNITNKKYISSAWINPDYINGAPAFIDPGLPRNFSFNLSLELDW